ncbi:MAG: hypothetical protein JWQ22_517, partial [Devosia sp.]|nr:hypothetical protein [Devosia sp.]
AAVPLNPGEGIADLSFAMFYNRLGWAALGFLLVLYLPPRQDGRRQFQLDALCATVLTLFLLYLKISYGLVAVAFLLFLLTDRRQWRLPLLVLAACAAGCLLVELLWRGTTAYLADLRLAGAVSGDLPDLQRLTSILMLNLADVAVYLIFGAVLLLARRSFRDVLFVGFCGATGILIIEQNFQIVGILTLAASAAVMASALSDRPSLRDRRIGAGLPLLLAILMLPVASQNAAALVLHSAVGVMRGGEQMWLPGFEGIRLVSLTNEGLYRNFSRYNQSLADGAAALAALDTPPERVVVFDFVGPFTAGLGLQPARGDYPWYHWGRTIDDDVHPAAEDVLADAEVIMEPKAPIEHWTAIGMRRIYGAYLEEDFRLARESTDWRIYVRERSGSGSSANTSVTKQSTSAQP